MVSKVLGPLGTRSGAVVWALMAVVGVVLCVVPLFDLLGYESSAAAGVAVSLLGPVIWLRDPHLGRFSPVRTPDSHRPHRIWARFVWIGVLLLAPILVLLLVNALRVPNCALDHGLAFFGLIAVGSAAVSSLWALLAIVLSPSKVWLRWVVYLAFWILSALGMGLVLLLEPPVKAFEPVIGFFAGSIYDEALSVPPQLALYRAWQAVFVAGVLLALDDVWLRRQGRAVPWGQRVAMVCAFGAVVGVYSQRAPLGLEIDRGFIEQELSGRHETEHFVLHYPPGTWHARRIEAIGQDHEFRHHQLMEIMGQGPLLRPGRKIHSYIYADQRQKGRLLGMRRTMIARLWLGELHILYRSVGQPVLMHELVHIFSSPHGSGPLSLSSGALGLPNMGLIEGLAEAITWQRGELTPHGWSAAMRRLKIAPDIRGLVRADGFYTTAGSTAYTLMGSFCRFLMDQHGVDKLLEVYAEGDFEGVYGVSVDELVGQWEEFLDAMALSDEELAMAEFYFDRKSIFEKRCARSIAALRVEGGDRQAERRFEQAIGCFEQAVAHSPRTARYRLELVEALLAARRLKEAQEEINAVLALEVLSRPNLAWALERQGDILAQQGKRSQARQSYQASLEQHPRLGRRRSLEARMASLGVEQAETYFFGRQVPTTQIYGLGRWVQSAPRDALANYLLGRRLYATGDCEEALGHLEASVKGRQKLPGPTLEQEALRLLGICQLQTGDLDGAQGSFEAFGEGALMEGQGAAARDWLARVRWARGR